MGLSGHYVIAENIELIITHRFLSSQTRRILYVNSHAKWSINLTFHHHETVQAAFYRPDYICNPLISLFR